MIKQFKTISKQRKHLVNSKNIVDDDVIENVLTERTYVSLINPYKEFFYTSKDENGVHIYDHEVKIDEYINLASLDDDIANKLHKYIGIFERKLKFVIAYEYSNYLANSKNDLTCTIYKIHLENISKLIASGNPDNRIYDSDLNELGFVKIDEFYSRKGQLKQTSEASKETAINYRKNIITDILLHSSQSRGIKKSEIIKHYIDKQGIPPFWLIVHQLSLGDLIFICAMLNPDLRERIYVNFKGIKSKNAKRKQDINRFYLQIDTIKNIRNTINHYEPLIIKFKKYELQKLEAALNLLKDTFETSIIGNYTEFDISRIRDTEHNEKSKDVFKKLINIIK